MPWGGSMQNKHKGFTLIELMVTIAVLAIIAMLAAPSFTQIMAKQKLNSNSRELMATLSQARSQAVLLRSNATVNINPSTCTPSPTVYCWSATVGNRVTAPTAITQIVFGRDGGISSGLTADTDFVICNSKAEMTRAFALTKIGTIYVKPNGTCQ